MSRVVYKSLAKAHDGTPPPACRSARFLDASGELMWAAAAALMQQAGVSHPNALPDPGL